MSTTNASTPRESTMTAEDFNIMRQRVAHYTANPDYVPTNAEVLDMYEMATEFVSVLVHGETGFLGMTELEAETFEDEYLRLVEMWSTQVRNEEMIREGEKLLQSARRTRFQLAAVLGITIGVIVISYVLGCR